MQAGTYQYGGIRLPSYSSHVRSVLSLVHLTNPPYHELSPVSSEGDLGGGVLGVWNRNRGWVVGNTGGLPVTIVTIVINSYHSDNSNR